MLLQSSKFSFKPSALPVNKAPRATSKNTQKNKFILFLPGVMYLSKTTREPRQTLQQTFNIRCTSLKSLCCDTNETHKSKAVCLSSSDGPETDNGMLLDSKGSVESTSQAKINHDRHQKRSLALHGSGSNTIGRVKSGWLNCGDVVPATASLSCHTILKK